MKTSYYCIPVDVGSGVLLFNSLTRAFLLLAPARFAEIYANGEFVQDVLTDSERNMLTKNGFWVSDDMDEPAIVVSARQQVRLNKRSYQLIVNPTLDCNLCCWYCYENHHAGSRLTPEMVERIKKHIDLKYQEDKFESFNLSFFGGEPLLATPEVVELIGFAQHYCDEKSLKLTVGFTTNGTVLSERLYDALRDTPTTFQITLDGHRDKHNAVRKFKANGNGTFDVITRNIINILNFLPKASITLRINYDVQTLSEPDTLLQFVSNFKGKNLTVSLHRVWQVSPDEIDREALFDFMVQIKNMGIGVSLQGFPLGMYTCYADKLNACVVNYNGDVFKCTARDFKSESRCGTLDASGMIVWNNSKLQAHCFSPLPERCQQCKLLPQCASFCSQNTIDSAGEPQGCALDQQSTIDEYVLMNYYLMQTKSEQEARTSEATM